MQLTAISLKCPRTLACKKLQRKHIWQETLEEMKAGTL